MFDGVGDCRRLSVIKSVAGGTDNQFAENAQTLLAK